MAQTKELSSAPRLKRGLASQKQTSKHRAQGQPPPRESKNLARGSEFAKRKINNKGHPEPDEPRIIVNARQKCRRAAEELHANQKTSKTGKGAGKQRDQRHPADTTAIAVFAIRSIKGSQIQLAPPKFAKSLVGLTTFAARFVHSVAIHRAIMAVRRIAESRQNVHGIPNRLP